MDSYIAPIIIGVVCIVSGVFYTKGRISTIHWYHRENVTEENRNAFGKIMGLGSIILGISMVVFGVLARVTELLEDNFFILIGVVFFVIGMVVALVLIFYATRKYNKSTCKD